MAERDEIAGFMREKPALQPPFDRLNRKGSYGSPFRFATIPSRSCAPTQAENSCSPSVSNRSKVEDVLIYRPRG
jgi:hypothetical protein